MSANAEYESGALPIDSWMDQQVTLLECGIAPLDQHLADPTVVGVARLTEWSLFHSMPEIVCTFIFTTTEARIERAVVGLPPFDLDALPEVRPAPGILEKASATVPLKRIPPSLTAWSELVMRFEQCGEYNQQAMLDGVRYRLFLADRTKCRSAQWHSPDAQANPAETAIVEAYQELLYRSGLVKRPSFWSRHGDDLMYYGMCSAYSIWLWIAAAIGFGMVSTLPTLAAIGLAFLVGPVLFVITCGCIIWRIKDAAFAFAVLVTHAIPAIAWAIVAATISDFGLGWLTLCSLLVAAIAPALLGILYLLVVICDNAVKWYYRRRRLRKIRAKALESSPR